MKRSIKSFGIMGLVLITGCSNSSKIAAEVRPTVVTEVADCKQGGACQVGEFGEGQWFGGQVIWVNGSDSTNYLQHGIDISSELYGESMISGENTKFQIPVPWCRYDPVMLPPELLTTDDGIGNTSKLIDNCFRTEEDFNNSYGSASSAIFNLNHQGSGVNWETDAPWSSWGTTSSWYVPTRQELLNIFESYRTNQYVFDIQLGDGCYWTSERSSADGQIYAVEYANDITEVTELVDFSRCFVIPIRRNPYRDQVTVDASNRSSEIPIPSASTPTSVELDNSSDRLTYSSEEILETITVGKRPLGIAVDTEGKFALVANHGSNTVSKIDLMTDSVIATINVEKRPSFIAIDPNGEFAYVVTGGSNVAKINLSIDSVTANIEIGSGASHIVIDGEGRFAYTVGMNPDTKVSQIDLRSGVMTRKFDLIGSYLTLDSSNVFLYVMNTSNGISKIDLRSWKLSANIEAGFNGCMVINREGTYAYVNGQGGGVKVQKIDLQSNTVIETIRHGKDNNFNSCLAIDPSKTFVYIPVDPGNNTISKINLATNEVKEIPVWMSTRYIAFNPNGKFAYATVPDSNQVLIIGR